MLTPRDLRIVARARELSPRHDFDAALTGLTRAVEELIPDGHVWPLGHTEHGVVVGSRITGLGIAPHPQHGAVLVRVRDGVPSLLGELLVKGTCDVDPAGLDDGVKRLLVEWLDIDWLRKGTDATASDAARLFEQHHALARGYEPELFHDRLDLTARISSWTELASLCDAVRTDSKWDWKFSALKVLSHQHKKARGWTLERAPESPLFIRLGEHVYWRINLGIDLRDVPPAAREQTNWYLSYTTMDLVHALEWELAEPGSSARNPFVPLLRCYATGFLPFMLDARTVTLWASR